METDRLRQFCTIVETGSFTRAARLLRISHSGLSKSMSTLEDQLEQKLFVADGRGIAVTDAGKRIYRDAQPLLKAVQELLHPVSDRSGPRPLRIGALEMFTSFLLGGILQHQLAGVPADVIETTPGHLEARVADGSLDVGLTFVPIPHSGVQHHEIAAVKLGIFVRENSFRGIEPTDLPFTVPATGLSENPLGVKERDGWPAEFWERKVAYRTNQLSIALDLARRGLSAVFIAEYIARLHNEAVSPKLRLEKVRVPKATPRGLERKVYLAARSNLIEGPEVKKLVAGVRTSISSGYAA